MGPRKFHNVSYSLKSLKGGYIGTTIGDIAITASLGAGNWNWINYHISYCLNSLKGAI